MLKIKRLNQQVIDDYYTVISKKVIDKKDSIQLSKKSKKILYDDYLEKLIKSTPAEMINASNSLMSELMSSYVVDEYIEYNVIKGKPKQDKTLLDKNLCRKYQDIDSKIRKIFDYEAFISQSQKTSYDLAKALDRNTCTYCNRLYTTTVQYKDPNTGRINNSTRITRPQFDHWFSQKYHPLLSLSIYNLIPSCSVCNTSIKGDIRLNLNDDIHPYILDDTANNFTFSYNKKNIDDYQVVIQTNNGVKISKFISDFKIKEIYDAHANYELKDLIDLRLKYSDNYLDTLLNNTFDWLKIGEEEIYRLIFGVELDSEKYHKRPFSKFKCDIIDELKKIK